MAAVAIVGCPPFFKMVEDDFNPDDRLLGAGCLRRLLPLSNPRIALGKVHLHATGCTAITLVQVRK